MSRKVVFLVVVLLAAFALTGILVAQSRSLGSEAVAPDRSPSLGHGSHDHDDEGLDDDEFADAVAGSYVLTSTLFNIFCPEDLGGCPFTGLQTYGADGTLISIDTLSYSLMPASTAPKGNQSSGHGGWVRTGPWTLVNKGVIYIFDELGDVLFIAAASGPVTFDPDFRHAETTFETALWCCTPDCGPPFCAGVPLPNPAVDPPTFPVVASGFGVFDRVEVD